MGNKAKTSEMFFKLDFFQRICLDSVGSVMCRLSLC
jgi:hypothetical protein